MSADKPVGPINVENQNLMFYANKKIKYLEIIGQELLLFTFAFLSKT